MLPAAAPGYLVVSTFSGGWAMLMTPRRVDGWSSPGQNWSKKSAYTLMHLDHADADTEAVVSLW